MSQAKLDLSAITFEQFKAYMLEKLEEFETESWKQEYMREYMKGEQTVPLGDWFEWFGCQAKLI